MARMSETLRRQRLADLEGLALSRLGKILSGGSDKDAIEAAKMVLVRTMPEPRASAADIARAAAMGAGAGASHLAAIASKATARLASPADMQTAQDATFEPARKPLVDVSTLGKGAKE